MIAYHVLLDSKTFLASCLLIAHDAKLNVTGYANKAKKQLGTCDWAMRTKFIVREHKVRTFNDWPMGTSQLVLQQVRCVQRARRRRRRPYPARLPHSNLPPLLIYKIKQIRLDRLVLVSGGGQATGRGLAKQH